MVCRQLHSRADRILQDRPGPGLKGEPLEFVEQVFMDWMLFLCLANITALKGGNDTKSEF